MTNGHVVSIELGQGGVATQRFIREEIVSRFSNASLSELEDGAYFSADSRELVITTDSFIVDPPVFPGGDIGRLAVSGTVNDLVASGAVPRILTLGLVVCEGFPLATLRQILTSMAETASSCQIEVVGGDTKVLERDKLGICLNTSGIGVPVRAGYRYRLADARIGDKIIVTGTIGNHALAVLSEREGLGLERRIRSDCTPLSDLILPVLRRLDGVHALRDPTRGGLAGVLHDLAEATGVDVFIETTKLPVEREVKFACEMLGLDPLDLINEGKMVVVVSPDQTADALAILRDHPLGQQAAVIGELHPRKTQTPRVNLIRADGTAGLVERKEGLPLPRLC